MPTLRVIELSRVLAGPVCGMILGDLGADVLKVERPKVGDETRGWGPPFDDRGQSAYFLAVNRNKKSIALDLGMHGDRDVLLRLIAGADVVVDNFLPGKLAGFGIDERKLLEEHAQLIWCSISGFGPGSTRPGYDFVVQGEAGWMAITGEPGGEPMKTGVALADLIAGKDAALAILGRVLERSAGDLPASRRRLHVSLIGSATAALVNVAQNVLVSGRDAGRWGNAHPNLVPYQLFHASDRAVIIAVGSDEQWIACARSLGLDELAADSDLRSNAGRLGNRTRIVSAIAASVANGTAAHWIKKLQAGGVPCGVVKSVAEALQSIEASTLTGVASPIGGTVRLPPPMLDADGPAVRTLGWRAFGP